MSATLLCFGYGYVASWLARHCLAANWRVIGTTRSEANCAAMKEAGVEPQVFRPDKPLDADVIASATHVLVSVPPGESDPVFANHGPDLGMAHLKWFGYLSTTGVYGDSGGAWVDEETQPRPGQDRSRARYLAEQDWLSLRAAVKLPVHVFRLPGIYGPGRSVLDDLRKGTARRIVRPGQYFSRIHVADIAAALFASMARPNPGRIYNLVDDEPAAAAEVVAYGAGLLGVEPPAEVTFEAAVANGLSPMAQSFYAENRRVRNERMKRELGVTLRYPSYREGLAGILEFEGKGRD